MEKRICVWQIPCLVSEILSWLAWQEKLTCTHLSKFLRSIADLPSSWISVKETRRLPLHVMNQLCNLMGKKRALELDFHSSTILDSHLGVLQRIRHLDLGNTKVTCENWPPLVNLLSLNLDWCPNLIR